ncbi:penicillin acylase family protein [Nocardioides convexus]|uniref:penicillin acylase family protein n=1 Tax=Nocardioides convexus TaxID=2712224 RepID=UPI002418399F|nr:penicillin acylase family protein [Nocardioides convexus]
MATHLAQQVLFGSLGEALWLRLAHEVLGDDARLLSHEGLRIAGSNAWVAGGERTASGLPMIGGDPHRTIEQPGIYQQVRLVCEDPDDGFDVLGYTFVGMPGVQHFAHAGEVAWAITNACADYQDLVEDGLPLAHGLSVRTASWVLGELGFDALLPLLRARTVDDVDAAFEHWVEPVNNLVIADRSGAVRYRVAGRVPVRAADGTWTGWLEAPNRADAGPGEVVVTANERRGPESEAIGSSFAPPYRAERIRALLGERRGLTTEDFAAIHDDALLPTVAILTRLVPGAFDDFDGVMAAGSAQAARFAAWRSRLVRRLAAHPALAPLATPGPAHDHGPLLNPSLDPVAQIGLALPTLAQEALAGRPPFGIDLPALARAALDDLADVPGTWGRPTARPRRTRSRRTASTRASRSSRSPATRRPCARWGRGRRSATRRPAAPWPATCGTWPTARPAAGWSRPGRPAGPAPTTPTRLDAWIEGRLLPIVTAWDQAGRGQTPSRRTPPRRGCRCSARCARSRPARTSRRPR